MKGELFGHPKGLLAVVTTLVGVLQLLFAKRIIRLAGTVNLV